MRVIALKQGYFGKLREPGESFEVPDDAVATWFAARHQSTSQPAVAPARPRKKIDSPGEAAP